MWGRLKVGSMVGMCTSVKYGMAKCMAMEGAHIQVAVSMRGSGRMAIGMAMGSTHIQVAASQRADMNSMSSCSPNLVLQVRILTIESLYKRIFCICGARRCWPGFSIIH